jgi:hypothetical protein
VSSMPNAVERRITTAIAAEATARRADSLAPAIPAPAIPATAQRRWSPRRALGSAGPRLRLSPVQMLVPVAACLLLAGLGYLLSVPGSTGRPSLAGPASALRSGSTIRNGINSHGQGGKAISPPNANSNSTAFLVTVSAIRYRKSTLRAQVNSQLAARQALTPGGGTSVITGTQGSKSGGNSSGSKTGTPTASPSNGANSSNTALVPSKSLVGCVMHLTGDVTPMLMQRATYQAEQAYVIAVSDRAWVVHLTCTAAKPALITSVALAPAS